MFASINNYLIWWCEMKNVFDNALVYGDARVSGDARVYGNARVSDNAMVSGDARVYGDAMVYGNARVSGDAEVSGDARVSGDAVIEKTSDYLVIGPAKSSGRFTTAHRDSKIGVRVNCGCFSGTVHEFSKAIETTHKDNQEALEQYRLFCQLIAFNFNVKP
jgi:UDP-3-O-[3-hydroxymyristoyl] glucosamine N-acyltransferase